MNMMKDAAMMRKAIETGDEKLIERTSAFLSSAHGRGQSSEALLEEMERSMRERTIKENALNRILRDPRSTPEQIENAKNEMRLLSS